MKIIVTASFKKLNQVGIGKPYTSTFEDEYVDEQQKIKDRERQFDLSPKKQIKKRRSTILDRAKARKGLGPDFDKDFSDQDWQKMLDDASGE